MNLEALQLKIDNAQAQSHPDDSDWKQGHDEALNMVSWWIEEFLTDDTPIKRHPLAHPMVEFPDQYIAYLEKENHSLKETIKAYRQQMFMTWKEKSLDK